jgi:predicted oxidoreductase
MTTASSPSNWLNSTHPSGIKERGLWPLFFMEYCQLLNNCISAVAPGITALPNMPKYLAAIVILLTLLLPACGRGPITSQADVIIVGAGIAGLAAALEAADKGAEVIVLDANSVGGGHAVKAGGLAMVDTALQRDKGIKDSPELATQELLAWGEDANPEWVKRYAEDSGTEVYDWLVKLGVEFKLILPTPESSIPRFHFTKGTAVHVVLPMLREALKQPNIRFLWSINADALLLAEDRVIGIQARNLRTGGTFQLYGGSIVLATGGFQSNIDLVTSHWREPRSSPGRLLIGSGQFANGSGYLLAAEAGAQLQRMDRQETFVNGIPDPRDATNTRGLTVTNRQAMLISEEGNRFVDEALPSKDIEKAVFAQVQQKFWMVFDTDGAKKLGVRGAAWLNTNSVRDEIINNPALIVTAANPEELAAKLGITHTSLLNSLQTYNTSARKLISNPPLYALQLHPLTRKSMGGPAINKNAQVLSMTEEVIPGLYAAGELTGVAGINGSYGGSGTFLGPSVYIGRIAGAAAAADSSFPTGELEVISTEKSALDLDGYWHYKVAHDVVYANQLDCDSCHKQTPMAEVASNQQLLTRLQTCLNCH